MKKKLLLVSVICLTVLLGGIVVWSRQGKERVVTMGSSSAHSMKLTSSVFMNQGKIPSKYTCVGEDVSPPLQFYDVPAGAKSFVLIVDDPDAPGGTWVHWVVYNISPGVKMVDEGSVPTGGAEGKSSFGEMKYGGPCPPSGAHRYFFKLYALDTTLAFEKPEVVDEHAVSEAMAGHVVDEAELVGLFSKHE